MIPYRVLVLTEDGTELFDYNYGEIENGCLVPILQTIEQIDASSKKEPKTIMCMDMGDYNISISTCKSLYFASVINESENRDHKSLNTLFSIFIGHGYSRYVASHRKSRDPRQFFDFEDSTFLKFEKELQMFLNPDITNYVAFFINGNLEYDYGKFPDNLKNFDDQVEVQAIMGDLSEICRTEEFAAYQNRSEVVVLPFFKHLQIGFLNNKPLDENDIFVTEKQTQIIIAKYTIPSIFIKKDPNEDEEEEENAEEADN